MSILSTRQNQERFATGLLVCYWATLLLGTHWPRQIIPEHGPFLGSDKVMHFSAYAGLGFLLLLVTFLRKSLTSPVTLGLLVAAVLLASAAGFIDEATQPIFGRDFEWYDWFADTIGATAGATLSLGLLSYLAVAPQSDSESVS